MVTVPRTALSALCLHAGSDVDVSVEGEAVVVRPRAMRPRYTMAELLAQCDPAAPMTADDREWVNSGPVGAELI